MVSRAGTYAAASFLSSGWHAFGRVYDEPMGVPQVRARYMQTFLEHVRALDPATSAAVLADIGAEGVATIDESRSFLAWVPVEVNLEATRAVAKRLGPRQTHDFFVRLQSATLETPLFDWVQRNAETLLGPDPTRRLKWIAKGYSIMFHAAGTWEVKQVGRNVATLEMVGVPAPMLRDRVWLDSVASSLHAVFPGGPTDTAVNLVGVSPTTGRALYRVRWVVAGEALPSSSIPPPRSSISPPRTTSSMTPRGGSSVPPRGGSNAPPAGD